MDMTEKRFIYFKNPIGFGKQGIEDKQTNEAFDFTFDNVLDVMNKLSDENKQLNVSRDELIHENRHIKNTIQTMLINERTRLGKSVLKQLWEAIQ